MAQITEVIDRPIDLMVCEAEVTSSCGMVSHANNL
jgi:hypothetical protein